MAKKRFNIEDWKKQIETRLEVEGAKDRPMESHDAGEWKLFMKGIREGYRVVTKMLDIVPGKSKKKFLENLESLAELTKDGGLPCPTVDKKKWEVVERGWKVGIDEALEIVKGQ